MTLGDSPHELLLRGVDALIPSAALPTMTRSERRSRTSDAADSSYPYTYYPFDGVMNYSNKAVVAVRIKEQQPHTYASATAASYRCEGLQLAFCISSRRRQKSQTELLLTTAGLTKNNSGGSESIIPLSTTNSFHHHHQPTDSQRTTTISSNRDSSTPSA